MDNPYVGAEGGTLQYETTRDSDAALVRPRRVNGVPLWMYVLERYIKDRGYRIK